MLEIRTDTCKHIVKFVHKIQEKETQILAGCETKQIMNFQCTTIRTHKRCRVQKGDDLNLAHRFVGIALKITYLLNYSATIHLEAELQNMTFELICQLD